MQNLFVKYGRSVGQFKIFILNSGGEPT